MVLFLSQKQFKLKLLHLKQLGLFPVCFLLVYLLEGFLAILFLIYRLIGPTLGGYLSKVENIKGVIRVFPIFKDVCVCNYTYLSSIHISFHLLLTVFYLLLLSLYSGSSVLKHFLKRSEWTNLPNYTYQAQ